MKIKIPRRLTRYHHKNNNNVKIVVKLNTSVLVRASDRFQFRFIRHSTFNTARNSARFYLNWFNLHQNFVSILPRRFYNIQKRIKTRSFSLFAEKGITLRADESAGIKSGTESKIGTISPNRCTSFPRALTTVETSASER